jgi:carboxymethylenebutenolidase
MRELIISATALLLAAVNLPAQDWAKAALEKSPRHSEWVTLKHDNREVNSFISYPEVKDKATAVVVIHEIFGLSDWARETTDELAAAGYIAIAPDLLWGKGPHGGGTDDLGGSSGAQRVIGSLPPDQITADLNAAVDYVSKLPSCNGKVVVVGFCWGGGQSFRFATDNQQVKATLSFYGPIPNDDTALARIAGPVYGFYAEKDNRITGSVTNAIERMKSVGKIYEPVIYKGAGHGFMREGEAPQSTDPNHEANIKARNDAWVRVKEILSKI